MEKIDLICDYLDSIGEVTFAHQGFAGVERLNKALAAARELRALEPVACRYEISGDAVFTDSPKREEIVRMTGIEATPLFALEVTK